MTTPDGALDPDDVRPPAAHLGPGPDRCTLRAVVELDLALDTDVAVDAAHALVSDLAERAFGHGWQRWYTEALAAEGHLEEPAPLLTDDDLADRVLARLHDRMRSAADGDPEAPQPPEDDHHWSAYPPGDPGGSRERHRRARRKRREAARSALLAPRRPRVAGARERR